MGSELATTSAADLVRGMPADVRHDMHTKLSASADTLTDEEFETLLALEQAADYENVTRLPRAQVVHHIAKPGIDLGGELVRELEAVVLLHSTRRGLWSKSETQAPLCASQDGVAPLQVATIDTTRGEMQTGPVCAGCAFNKWDSAGLLDLQDADRSSKACKEQRLLLLLGRGRDLPMVMFIAPTSLKGWEQFLADSAFAKRPLIRFYVRISVDKTSSGGFDYGTLRFEFGDPVDGQDLRRMFALRRSFEAGIQQVTAAAEEAE